MKRLIIHNHFPARDVVSKEWEKAIGDGELSSVDMLKANTAEQYRLREAIQAAHREGNRPKVTTLEHVLKHVVGRGNAAVQAAVNKEQAKLDPPEEQPGLVSGKQPVTPAK